MMMTSRLTTLARMGCACLVAVIATQASAALVDLTPQGAAFNSNESVKLSELLSGDVMGIQVGDKVFDGFSYSRIGDMPAASDINVLGFRDPSGNWGVSFHGTFVDLPGGSFSDALIRFVAQVAPFEAQRGWRISDAHLFIGGVGVGANSVFTVDETFLESNQTLNAYKSTIGQGGTQLSDWAYLEDTVTKLHVTKDIFALAGEGAIVPARTTVIDQSFSQIQIPEPATMSMTVAMALIGFAVRRK